MPQLDRLLSLMVSQRATALKLDENELAELEIAGAARPMTKTPLTGPQVVALLREIAPSESAALLDGGMPTQFDYVSEDGAFCVNATRDGTHWRARVTIDERRERQRLKGHPQTQIAEDTAPVPPAPSPAPAIPPAAAVAPSAPVPAAAPVTMPSANGTADADAIGDFAGSSHARATLDDLLRTMVTRGASDLHLRCGEPPIVRLHGEMTRLDGAALDPAGLDAMIRSVMPERNRREYMD